MYEKELSVAINSAKLAGGIIMSYFDKVDREVNLKRDNTLVTKADVESNKIIVKEIMRNFPSDGIISEELQEVKGGRKWYIDPLDGTESFVRKSDEFGIHIGLCEEGIPVLGVVYRVAKGEIYYGVKNQGTFKENKEGKTLLKIPVNLPRHMILVSSYGDKALSDVEEYIKLLPIKDVVKGAATGLRILKLAEGEADIYILSSSKIKPWDICAPHAILQEAGGQVSYADGTKVLYNQEMTGDKTILFTRTIEQLSYARDKLKHMFVGN